jgi:predicted Zn-dependent protease
MAKLPSQEDTALAFAEVYTVIEYLHGKSGWKKLVEIIDALRGGADDAAAIRKVTGRTFTQFQAEWQAWLRSRKLALRPQLVTPKLQFKRELAKGKHGRPNEEDDPTTIREAQARDHAKLGGFLRTRKRLAAAAAEYEKAQLITGPGHPIVSTKLARTYLELGQLDRAIAAAQPVVASYPDLGGPTATLADAHLRKGEVAQAEPYLDAGLRLNPFDPAIHCGLERVYTDRADERAKEEAALCKRLGGR